MQRRTVLKLVAAGVLPGSNSLVQLADAQDRYKPEFFSDSELDLLDALTEVILPSDDHSPGARAAMVARYIDVTVSDGSRAVQRRWRAGLEAVSNLARSRFKRGFGECDPAQQDEVVREMSRNEASPRSEVEQFFALVKQATIDGYYTSRVGIHEELGYKGNTAVDEFRGCSHGEHV